MEIAKSKWLIVAFISEGFDDRFLAENENERHHLQPRKSAIKYTINRQYAILSAPDV